MALDCAVRCGVWWVSAVSRTMNKFVGARIKWGSCTSRGPGGLLTHARWHKAMRRHRYANAWLVASRCWSQAAPGPLNVVMKPTTRVVGMRECTRCKRCIYLSIYTATIKQPQTPLILCNQRTVVSLRCVAVQATGAALSASGWQSLWA